MVKKMLSNLCVFLQMKFKEYTHISVALTVFLFWKGKHIS